MHSCDNPPCVNVEHLTLGTDADNVRDMDAKGRRGRGRAKVTAAQVVEMRELRAAGETCNALAVRFGISPSAVSMATRGVTWKAA